jgi:hypothetical protein
MRLSPTWEALLGAVVTLTAMALVSAALLLMAM